MKSTKEKLAYAKWYRKTFPEKVAACVKRSEAKRPNYYKSLHRSYYERNKDRILKMTKAWAKKHPEIMDKSRSKWRSNHREQEKEIARKYREANPEKTKAAIYSWRNKNRHKQIEYNHRRRARVKSTAVDCTDKIIFLKWSRKFCHWCCKKLNSTNFTIDHVTPIARHGAHVPDNLVAACRRCNTSRNDKLVSEWTWTLNEEAA